MTPELTKSNDTRTNQVKSHQNQPSLMTSKPTKSKTPKPTKSKTPKPTNHVEYKKCNRPTLSKHYLILRSKLRRINVRHSSHLGGRFHARGESSSQRPHLHSASRFARNRQTSRDVAAGVPVGARRRRRRGGRGCGFARRSSRPPSFRQSQTRAQKGRALRMVAKTQSA